MEWASVRPRYLESCWNPRIPRPCRWPAHQWWLMQKSERLVIGGRGWQAPPLDLLLYRRRQLQERQGPDNVRLRDGQLGGELAGGPSVPIHQGPKRAGLLDRP